MRALTAARWWVAGENVCRDCVVCETRNAGRRARGLAPWQLDGRAARAPGSARDATRLRDGSVDDGFRAACGAYFWLGPRSAWAAGVHAVVEHPGTPPTFEIRETLGGETSPPWYPSTVAGRRVLWGYVPVP